MNFTFSRSPRAAATRYPVQQRADHRVVHHGQAGGAADDDLRGRRAQHFGEDGLHLRQPVEAAVVASITAVAALVVGLGQHHRQLGGEVELLGRGLASRHVQLEALRLERVVTLLEFLREGCTFWGGKFRELSHGAGALTKSWRGRQCPEPNLERSRKDAVFERLSGIHRAPCGL